MVRRAHLICLGLCALGVSAVYAQGSALGADHAQGNRTCSASEEADGSCGLQRQPVDSASRPFWLPVDDELLTLMEKHADTLANRPAALPTYLPENSVGGSQVTDLPQPPLTRSHADAAPPSRPFVMGGIMDPRIALGLY